MTDSKIESAKKLLVNGIPPRDVAKNLSVSTPTLYRWIPAAGKLDSYMCFLPCPSFRFTNTTYIHYLYDSFSKTLR